MKNLIKERLQSFDSNVNDATMTVSRELLVDIVISHSKRNSSYMREVENVIQVDTINSYEHLKVILSKLNDNQLETLLLKI